MKSRSLHNNTKKGFLVFFYRDVTAFHEVPLTPLPLVFRHVTSQKMLRPTRPLCVA